MTLVRSRFCLLMVSAFFLVSILLPARVAASPVIGPVDTPVSGPNRSSVGYGVAPGAGRQPTIVPVSAALPDNPQKTEDVDETWSDAASPAAVARMSQQTADFGPPTTSFGYWPGGEAWSATRSDGWTDLNQYRYKSAGPIQFNIRIAKYLGPVDGSGHVTAENPLFGTFVILQVHAFDVDSTCPLNPCPSGAFLAEQDEVRMNGQHVGFLNGTNANKTTIPFKIPVSSLVFKSTYADPAGGVNTFEILVDQLDDWDRWAVAILGADLLLPPAPETLRPTVLLHGVNGTNGIGIDNAMTPMREALAIAGFNLEAIFNPDSTDFGTLKDDLDRIEVPINEFLTNSGWDQLNIVGHSMGGLIARAYASAHASKVKSIIMIGVPNGGVPSLDGCFAAALKVICDALPVSYQISQSRMVDFNWLYRDREGVRYLSQAGTHGGLCIWVFPAIIDYVGIPNDGCISLPSAEHLVDGENGGKEVTLAPWVLRHNELPQDEQSTGPISRLLLGTDPWPQVGNLFLVPALTTVLEPIDVVVPAGGYVDVPLSFEGAQFALIDVIVPAPSLTATIDGQALELVALGNGPARLTTTRADLADQSLRISNPANGPANAHATILVQLTSNRRLTVTPSRGWASIGETLAVSVDLTDSSGADVPTAELVTQSGSHIPVALTASGPGTWVGTTTLTTPGATQLITSVTGSRPRTARSMVNVATGAVSLGNGFGQALVDPNADGMAETLVLSPTASAVQAGSYRVTGRLVDFTGTEVSSASVDVDLAAGSQSVDLPFDASDIVASGIAGPYRLVDVLVLREETAGTIVAAGATDLGATQAYALAAFEHESMAFDTSTFESQGVADTGSSPFNHLAFSGDVTIETPGDYVVTASLFAADGTIVASAAGVEQVVVGGSYPFTLSFDGGDILAAGKDGPYEVRGLTVSSISNLALSRTIQIAHTTAAYSASQFAPGAATTSTIVQELPAVSTVAPISITFAWNNAATTTELWSRFRVTASDPWGAWELADPGTWQNWQYPFSFAFGDGPGFYEFATVAIDVAAVHEALPEPGDASTEYAPALGSSAGPVLGTTSSSSLSVPYTAGFGSGFGSVELWQRFKAVGGSFGPWGVVATATSTPISLTLGLGDGRYEFYTIAVDSLGPREDPPTTADTATTFDTTPPTSSISPIPAVTTTAGPITLQCNAADAGSGVGSPTDIAFYMRAKASPADPSPAWQSWGSCQTDGIYTFDFPYGAWYYEFATSTIDLAGNHELVPTNADTGTQYDPPPVSQVQSLPPLGKQTYLYLTATSTRPYEIWERYEPAGSSQFGPWTMTGTGSPGGSSVYTPLADGDGRYEFYSLAYLPNGTHEAPPAVADTFTVLDTTPPTTAASAAPPRIGTASIDVPFTYSDGNGGGVRQVVVWSRYRPTDSGGWGSWVALGVSNSPSDGHLPVTLTNGEGFYEFHTRGFDWAGNTEAAPASGDAWTHFTTSPSPSSNVGLLPAAWNSSNLLVPFQADFASGSGSVELWQRFQAAGSGSWTAWAQVAGGSTSPLSNTLALGAGRYEFYTVAVDSAGPREATPAAADAFTVLDTTAPSSTVGALPVGTTNAFPSVSYTASDNANGVGIGSVELWQRFQAAGSPTWSSWTIVWTGTVSPVAISLDAGAGRYEFYTISVDAAGNREAAPASADAFTILDWTAPTSSAGPMAGAVASTSTAVPYSAADTNGSGVASVELWQRFRAAGSGTWSSWSQVATGSASPINVTLGSGNGRYEFYTRANDAAGNRESAPAAFDAFTVLDTAAPVTSVGSIPAAVANTALSVPYTASDTNGTGVATVELWRRFQAAGSGTWSSWTMVTSGAVSPLSVTLASGNGRYEFYTIGIDVAGNREAAPSAFDAFTVLTVAPVTSASALASPGHSTSISVAFTASGTSSVELWRRFQAAGSGTWSAWALVTSGPTSPFAVTLPSGAGRYEFYTIGIAPGGAREAAPGIADTFTVLDTTAPTSTVGTVPSTSSGTSFAVPFTASDNTNGTGIGSIELWTRFRANDTVSTGTWTLVTSGTGGSGNLTLPFGSGVGLYDISTIAIDAAGNREGGLAQPSTPKSMIRSINWGASVKVNTDTGTALQDNMSCGLGTDGTAYCVWEDRRSGNPDIYFAQRNPTTGVWSGELKLNSDTGTTAQQTPAIAVDGSNNLYVVWADERNTSGTANTDIYFAKRTGTTWGANTKLNADATTSVQNAPRIAVSSAGIAVVVWVDLRSSQKNVYSGRLPAGSSTWSANFKVTTNTAATKGRPDVAVATDGTAHAVWEDATSGNADVDYATLGPTATMWSTNTKISDDTTTGAESWPRIGLTSANGPTAAWVDGRVANLQVRVSQKSGSSWTASIQVSDASAKPTSLAFTVKTDGGVVAAWGDTRVATSAIWGAQCESGATAVTRCAAAEKWSDQTGVAVNPSLAANTTKVYLGWRDDTVGGGDVRFRVRTPS